MAVSGKTTTTADLLATIANELGGEGEGDNVTLLTAAAATGSTTAVSSGRYNWYAYGTWNGATAQLQWSPDSGVTWINIDGASLTADGGYSDIPISSGSARVSLSGVGSPAPSLSSLLGRA